MKHIILPNNPLNFLLNYYHKTPQINFPFHASAKFSLSKYLSPVITHINFRYLLIIELSDIENLSPVTYLLRDFQSSQAVDLSIEALQQMND
jgi:hypothetical protein